MKAILCHTLGPYHIARYTALSKLRDDFVVLEFGSEQSSHTWKSDTLNIPFPIITLHKGPLLELSPRVYTKKLLVTLDNLNPNLIGSLSYFDQYMRAATMWARKHKAASMMINESWQGDKRRNIVLETLKSLWCRWAYDGAFVSGIKTSSYYHELGIPEDRIWRGCDVVDNDHFASGSKTAQNNSFEIRKILKLPEKYFLGAFRFIPAKNIHRLLLAYKSYLNSGGDWDLVIIGGGPEEQDLRQLSEEISEVKIHIMGWKNYEELPSYYGLASGFILPSVSEPWGLVVNEAMASGLPVLVSSKCGCLPELCLKGVNGFEFDPYKCDEITNAMLILSSLNSEELKQMGEASHKIIQNYSPDTMALSLSDCMDSLSK